MIPHKLWLHWSSGFRGKFEHTHIHKHIDTFSRKPSVLNICTCPYILVYQTQHLRVVPDKIKWGIFAELAMSPFHHSVLVNLSISMMMH